MKKAIEIKDGKAILSIDPSIYPLAVIYAAAYVYLERAYIHLDGAVDEEILVTLAPKDRGDSEEMANLFLIVLFIT